MNTVKHMGGLMKKLLLLCLSSCAANVGGAMGGETDAGVSGVAREAENDDAGDTADGGGHVETDVVDAGRVVVVGCYIDGHLALYPCTTSPDADNVGAVRTSAGACPSVGCAIGSPCEVWVSWSATWRPGTCRSWPEPANYEGGPVLFPVGEEHPLP